MNPFIDPPIQSETLSQEELQQLTGAARKRDQTIWLQENGWVFLKNRAGDPIVGRFYARLKLAGIQPNGQPSHALSPNFTNVR